MKCKFHVSKFLMIQGFIYSLLFAICIPFIVINAYSAHPLITDDTGTQGTGKFQIEINGEHSKDNGDKATENYRWPMYRYRR